MKLVTNTIVLAIYLASIVTSAAPTQWYAQGLEIKHPDSTCPTWRINYSVEDEHGGYYLLNGYFEIDSCFDRDLSVGDGTFVLDIKRESRAAVLTEYSSGVAIAGHFYANDRAHGNGATCWYGGGPHDGDDHFLQQFCLDFA